MRNEAPIVIALGGNAISRESEEGNVDQQFANSRLTAKALADLVVAGHRLVITHGNGPQIGNFLLRNEAAAGVIYQEFVAFQKSDRAAVIVTDSFGIHADSGFLAGVYQKALAKLQ